MKKLTSLAFAVSAAVASMGMVGTANAIPAEGAGWSVGDLFVGVEGGYTWTKVSASAGTGFEPFNKSNDGGGLWGVRFGSYFDDLARAYLTVGMNMPKKMTQNGEKIDKIRQLNLLASADWMFMPEWEVRPFLGVTLGAVQTKADTSKGDYKKAWGFAYGAQFGGAYTIGDNFEVEAGFRYISNTATHHYRQDHETKGSELKVRESKQLFLAASYSF